MGLESSLPVSRAIDGFILSHSVFLYSTMKFYEQMPEILFPAPKSNQYSLQEAQSQWAHRQTKVNNQHFSLKGHLTEERLAH